MSKSEKALKGYIKTENVILLVAITLAIGFVAGVVFSAYRSSRSVMPGFEASSPRMTAQEKAKFEALQERTQNDPRDFQAWVQLGHLYFDAGLPQQAIEAYETSLEIDADRPDIWTDIGVMYRRTGKPDKSIECFDKALARDPGHQIALYNKGIILMHDLKDPEAALSVWQTLVGIHPDAKTPTGEPMIDLVEQLKRNIEKQPKGSQD